MNACDPCNEINDLLTEIYGIPVEDVVTIPRTRVLAEQQSNCCGEGYIKRNGVCVLWANIKSENGITVEKHYYDHDGAVAYLLNQSNTFSSVSNFGLDLLPGSATASGWLIDAVINMIGKLKNLSYAGTACSVVLGTYQLKYTSVSEKYNSWLTKYVNDNDFKDKGLYAIISSSYLNSSYGMGTLITINEIYSSDGCLIGKIGY